MFGYPQSWNLYTYVRNDPLNGTDPDGEVQCAAACNSPAPPPDPGAWWLNPAFLRVVGWTVHGVSSTMQQTQQFAQPVIDWIKRKDWNCVSGATVGGALAGAAGGAARGAAAGLQADRPLKLRCPRPLSPVPL